jgi:hypothetical protein
MSKHQKAVIVVAAACLIAGFTSGMFVAGRGIPFLGKEAAWSIGVYNGLSPVDSFSSGNVSNPVLTARDVADVPAKHVADPFMVRENHTWYMFFKVINAETDQGDIGLATSEDGLNWTYEQIVLDEPFHLSYPYVFRWQDEYYMIPESFEANSIRLYRADDFPLHWSFVGTLLDGGDYVDSSIFRFNDDRWWLFTATPENDTLRLYYAQELLGPWIEHPESPIVEGDSNIARPGGRVLVFDGRIIRYAQDDDDSTYGKQVRAFEITELSTASYQETEVSGNPIVEASGTGWNGMYMHHVDIHQITEDRWIASVDGCGEVWVFGLKY